MKTYVLNYGAYPRHNEIVTKHMELTKICDGIYYHLFEENEEDQDKDELLVVLNVKGVYFVHDSYCRKEIFCERELENLAQYRRNWVSIIKKVAGENQYIRNMEIAVFRALNLDTSNLLSSRETFLENVKKQEQLEKEKNARLKKAEQEQKEQEENKKLDGIMADFMADKYISSADFLAIAKRDKFSIHIRTIGTIRHRLTYIRKDGAYLYHHVKGKRKPDTRGFGNALSEYVEFLETQQSDDQA